MKLYRNGQWKTDTRRFVRTGEFRSPRLNEFFLSGAIPEVYQAAADLTDDYYIMRPATPAETHCQACGQRKPDA